MDQRLKLHELLVSILGSSNVYFQPPQSIKLVYPCIVYNLDDLQLRHANNKAYSIRDRYLITHISRDPDDQTPDKIARLPLASFSRAFVADNLNHQVFNLYF